MTKIPQIIAGLLALLLSTSTAYAGCATAADCNDSNPCTEDVCNPATGCLNTPNIKICDDGNACTTDDVCSNGTCGGKTLSCDDMNICTDDSCKADVGCKYANNSLPCNDNDACTNNEQCTNGTCHGTPSAGQCDDLNGCTDDSCNPATGCTNQPNIAPCNDNSACTHNDACSNGTCSGIDTICDDGNACNGPEICDPKTGVCPAPQPNSGPSFVFCHEARINNRMKLSGSVLVNDPNGTLRIARDVMAADGTTMTANDINLGVNASVFNTAHNTISLARGAVVRGASTSPVVLPVLTPCCSIPPTVCTGTEAPVTVGKNQTLPPLAPGTYGSLVMLNNASVTLMPGVHTFCGDMLIARNAAVMTMGVVTANVSNDFRIGNLSTFSSKGGSPLPALNVGGVGFRLGQSANVTAVINAPNAEGHFARASSISGTMCMDSAATDKSLVWGCGPQD